MAEAQLDLGRRMPCDSAVQVGDWVFIRADSKADLADSSDAAKMPSIGFVSHKQGADLCFVKTSGLYTRPPQTFTSGAELFISNTQPGRIVEGEPPGAAVTQKVGDADPDGLTVIVNLELKTIVNLSLEAGGEVVRTPAGSFSVGEVVYLRSDGLMDLASATGVGTISHRAVVSAIDDPSPGLIKIQFSGDSPAAYSGLIVGKLYIVGRTPGSIVAEDDTLNPDYPDTTPGSGHVFAEVGVAISPTTLFIGTLRDFEEV